MAKEKKLDSPDASLPTGPGQGAPKKNVDAPEVPAPEKSAEELVRVRITKDVNNIFIGGRRYTYKKDTTQSVSVEVAHTLRSSGSAI